MSLKAAVALPLLFLLGCDSTQPSSFSIAIDDDLVAFQGDNFTVPLTITRSNFSGDISFSVSGAPAGVVATLPASATSAQTSVNLTIDVDGSAVPGSSDLVITASGAGAASQTATTTLTVNLQGTVSLAMFQADVTAAQGGSAEAIVLSNRSGQNRSLVTLEATGLPAGVTARWSSTTTSGPGTTLWLDATGAAPIGSHQVTINGTAAGLPAMSTVVTLNITAAPAVAPLTMTFCASDVPVWVAYRNEGFGWQPVTLAGGAATYNATERTTIAIRFSQTDMLVYSATRDDLDGTRFNCTGDVTVTGVFSGLSGQQLGVATVQGELITRQATTPEFSIPGRRAEVSDLVGARAVVADNPASLRPDRLYIRRDINLATTTSAGEVNFTNDGITPITSAVGLTGGATGERLGLFAYLRASNRSRALISSELQTPAAATLQHFPNTSLVAADMHELIAEALFQSTTEPRITLRQRTNYVSQIAPATVALPPAVPRPTIDSVASSPYRRTRARVTSVAEYDGLAQVLLYNGSQNVWMVQTSGFAGSVPATWSLVVPDFTGVPGFNVAWMSPSGQNYQAEMYSAPTARFFGAPPVDGQVRLFGLDLQQNDLSSLLAPGGRGMGVRVSRAPGAAEPGVR